MTLNECCDEIARLSGWTLHASRLDSKWRRDMPMGKGVAMECWQDAHPISELDDLVDNWPPGWLRWPPGWLRAGTGTHIGAGPTTYGAMALSEGDNRRVITVRGHSSMFEAEAFLLLKVLQGEGGSTMHP